MKWVNKKNGKTFVTEDKNLFSMLEREGYEPEKQKKEKEKE